MFHQSVIAFSLTELGNVTQSMRDFMTTDVLQQPDKNVEHQILGCDPANYVTIKWAVL